MSSSLLQDEKGGNGRRDRKSSASSTSSPLKKLLRRPRKKSASSNSTPRKKRGDGVDDLVVHAGTSYDQSALLKTPPGATDRRLQASSSSLSPQKVVATGALEGGTRSPLAGIVNANYDESEVEVKVQGGGGPSIGRKRGGGEVLTNPVYGRGPVSPTPDPSMALYAQVEKSPPAMDSPLYATPHGPNGELISSPLVGGGQGFENPMYQEEGDAEELACASPIGTPAGEEEEESHYDTLPSYDDGPYNNYANSSSNGDALTTTAATRVEEDDGYFDISPVFSAIYDNLGAAAARGLPSDGTMPDLWGLEEVKAWLEPIVHEDSWSSWQDAVESGNLTGARMLKLSFANLKHLENSYYEVFRDIGSVFEALQALKRTTSVDGSDARATASMAVTAAADAERPPGYGEEEVEEPLYDNVHFMDVDESSSPAAAETMPWHHGRISRLEAERLLTNAGGEEGLFLVRTRDQHSGALSVCTYEGIEHYMLEEIQGFYTINRRRVNMARTLPALVTELQGEMNNPLQVVLDTWPAKRDRSTAPKLMPKTKKCAALVPHPSASELSGTEA